MHLGESYNSVRNKGKLLRRFLVVNFTKVSDPGKVHRSVFRRGRVKDGWGMMQIRVK